jgi:hypothetical protein
MGRPSTVGLVVALIALGCPAVHAARRRCIAVKLRASGRYAAEKARCVAESEARMETAPPGCAGEAEMRLRRRFAKAETKAGCVTFGDAGAIESMVDAFVGGVVATVTGTTGAPSTPSRCDAGKIAATGRNAAASARCTAKATATGRPVPPGCEANATATFETAVAKAEAAMDCARRGQAGILEATVAGFIDDLASALGRPPDVTTTTLASPQGSAHYAYVFPDGSFSVYDMDAGHRLVKSVALPQARGIRGVVANAPTHALYVSYGGDGNGQNGTPTMLKYDLLTDAVVWTHTYAVGVDSMSVTPDGRYLYLPTGELASGGTWYVVLASTGDVVGTIAGPSGPHNTIVGFDGARVYLGGRGDNYLAVADTATRQVTRRIGPLQNTVRPFTIDGRETLAYITVTGFRGFQIGDLATGQVLRTVTFTGPNVSSTSGPSAPSHGISLSPDERELYVVDWPDWVHVFDVSQGPGQAPRQVADIALTPSMNHKESPCLYDCLADGWLMHSRDGRFVYVGDQGDVIDTATRRPLVNLTPLANTRKMIEIDWAQGVPTFAATARASVGYVR